MPKKPPPTIGEELVGGFEELLEAVRRDPASVPANFRVRTLRVLKDPQEYGPKQVRQTRGLLDASQVVFARLIGVSPQTVRAWEDGRNVPQPVARRLMDEIRRNPDYWQERLRELAEA